MTVFENYYLTTDNFNTTANQQEYGSAGGVATDIFKIRRVELNYDVSNSNSAPTKCVPIDFDEVNRDLGMTNAGIGVRVSSAANYYFYGHGSGFTIGFIPIPDKTGTNAGKMWYIRQLSDLSSDSENIDIPYPDRYWINIAYGATADALRFGQQDSPEGDKFEQKMIAGIVLMQEELEDYAAESTKTVIDTTGAFIDFET